MNVSCHYRGDKLCHQQDILPQAGQKLSAVINKSKLGICTDCKYTVHNSKYRAQHLQYTVYICAL